MYQPLKNMRKFHNFIKKEYLNKYTNKPCNLLDLASGKGGDLNKWKNNKNIKSVIGYDIDEVSVLEARKRLKELKIKKPIKFYVKDLGKYKIICKEKVEIITSHFAFHYFFKSSKTLKTILQTIDNCSKSGTILILTLFDGSVVKNLNNNDYKVTILDPEKKSNYNKRVEVYIKDSVLNTSTVEYIVNPEFLKKKLKEIGFKIIETKLFNEIENTKIKLSKSEKELSFINRIFIFEKE